MFECVRERYVNIRKDKLAMNMSKAFHLCTLVSLYSIVTDVNFYDLSLQLGIAANH